MNKNKKHSKIKNNFLFILERRFLTQGDMMQTYRSSPLPLDQLYKKAFLEINVTVRVLFV